MIKKGRVVIRPGTVSLPSSWPRSRKLLSYSSATSTQETGRWSQAQCLKEGVEMRNPSPSLISTVVQMEAKKLAASSSWGFIVTGYELRGHQAE